MSVECRLRLLGPMDGTIGSLRPQGGHGGSGSTWFAACLIVELPRQTWSGLVSSRPRVPICRRAKGQTSAGMQQACALERKFSAENLR
jgi:hypothetical protein